MGETGTTEIQNIHTDRNSLQYFQTLDLLRLALQS
jgi:hypothetical protein